MRSLIMLLLLIAAVAISGYVGTSIASHGHLDLTSGFWLGAGVGVVALMVVAALKRRSDASSSSAQENRLLSVREVSDGRYRLWLVAKPSVRNGGLPWNDSGQEKQFWSRKAALAYARQQEREASIRALERSSVQKGR